MIDLVNTCSKYNVRYVNNIGPKAEKRMDMISSVVTYGFFGLMLAVLFFFVISCIAKDEEVRFGQKYSILSRFGTPVGRMKTEKRIDAVRRTLPLLLAFPAEAVIGFIAN